MFFNKNNLLSKINVINGKIRKYNKSTGGFCDINTTGERLKLIFKRNFFNIVQKEKKNETDSILDKIIKNEQIITLLGSVAYYGINIIGKKRLGTIIINSKRAGILGYVNYITESAKMVKEYILSFNPLIISEKIIEEVPQVIEKPIINVVEATITTGYSNQTIILLGIGITSLAILTVTGLYIGWMLCMYTDNGFTARCGGPSPASLDSSCPVVKYNGFVNKNYFEVIETPIVLNAIVNEIPRNTGANYNLMDELMNDQSVKNLNLAKDITKEIKDVNIPDIFEKTEDLGLSNLFNTNEKVDEVINNVLESENKINKIANFYSMLAKDKKSGIFIDKIIDNFPC